MVRELEMEEGKLGEEGGGGEGGRTVAAKR